MPKAIVNNDVLSYRAKGIMAYLLSKPDDWTVYLSDIVKRSKEGMTAIRTAVKELEDAGYIQKERTRDDATGRIDGWVWYVYESPICGKPKDGFPTHGFPTHGKSDATNNNGSNNNDNKNKHRPVSLFVEIFGKIPAKQGVMSGEDLCLMLEEAARTVGMEEYTKILEWSQMNEYKHMGSRIKAIQTAARNWDEKKNDKQEGSWLV